MTDAELLALIERRYFAAAELWSYPGILSDMAPTTRARVDRLSAEFRSLGAGIAAELRRRAAPFDAGKVSYRLTHDGLSYAACDRKGRPLHAPAGMSGRGLVHDYARPIPACRRTA